MHAGSDIRRQTLLWTACLGLCGLQACSASPYGKLPEEPPYGQAYRATLKAQELPPRVVEQADGLPFLEWVERVYDPVALERDFKPHAVSTFVVDRLLRRE